MLSALILVAWAFSNGLELHTFPALPPETRAVRVEAWVVQEIQLLAENRSNNNSLVTFGPSSWDRETGCTSCLRVLSAPSPLVPPVVLEACESVTFAAVLAPFDGTTDFAGPSGLSVSFWTETQYSATVIEPAAVARLVQGSLWVDRASSFQGQLQGGSGTIGSRMRNGARVRVWAVP